MMKKMPSDVKIRTSVNSTACSPSTEASTHILDTTSTCSSSTNESSYFKENVNINISETPKLSMEPLQMKRKKKGGGYNLRKSLAWDKAFFTEEGVLDPVELSVISGATTSRRERLPLINGATPGSKPQIKCGKNLLKKMEDEHLGRDRSKDWSSRKIESASSINLNYSGSRKLTTHLGKVSGSRCGDCPRPLPSASLKRHSATNVGKAAGKDLKLPKFPGIISSHRPISVSNMNSILKTKSVTHNQNDFDIQINPGSTSFSRSFQNNQNASESSSLRPPRYSDGNSVNSSFKRLSSESISPVLADNSSSRIMSDISTPARSVNSSEDKKESTSSSAFVSRYGRVCDTAIHPLTNPPIKPSGLRMPSPSLSFFSQPMCPVIPDLAFRDKETYKHKNARLQNNLRRKPKVDSEIPARTISGNGRSTSSEHMASSHVNAIEPIKPKIEEKHVRKIPHYGKYSIGKITNEERKLWNVGTELPPESGSREQVLDDKVCSEHMSLSQQGSRYSGSSSMESLERSCSRIKAENSYFGSKHFNEDHTNETSLPKLQINLPMEKICMENDLCASSVGSVDKAMNKSGEGMALSRNTVSNTSNRLLPEKQSCLQSSLLGENDEKLISVLSDRQDPNEVMNTMAQSSLSSINMRDCNFDEVKISGHLVSTKLDYVDNSSLCEIHSGVVSASSNKAGVLPDNPADRNLSNSLPEDTSKLKIDYCSSFHERRTGETSQENAFGKVPNTGAILQDGSADSLLRERESGVDNVRNSQDTESVLVLSPEINMLKEFGIEESQQLTLLSDTSLVEKLEHHSHRLNCENHLPVKCHADVSSVDNVMGDTDLETRETEFCSSTSTSTSFTAGDTALTSDAKCNDACEAKGYTADATHDLSRVEPFFDTTRSRISEDTNCPLSCQHPKSYDVSVESERSPNNICWDDLNKNNSLSVLRQNAIPFSEEWLAAIEAAGEDILSKKGGAVQNSPPDKSSPEPGPWSPVKRKNNEIGPFDCTKFTNATHS